MADIAIATELRTLGLKGVWGLRPQPGVLPLHPVLTSMAMAIAHSCNLPLLLCRANQNFVHIDARWLSDGIDDRGCNVLAFQIFD